MKLAITPMRIPGFLAGTASALVQGVLWALGAPLAPGWLAALALILLAIFAAGELRLNDTNPEALPMAITNRPTRPRFEVAIPSKFPLSLVVKLDRLIGAPVLDSSGVAVAEIENVATKDPGPDSPGALQIGLTGLDRERPLKSIGIEIDRADPLEDADLPGKWFVSKVFAK